VLGSGPSSAVPLSVIVSLALQLAGDLLHPALPLGVVEAQHLGQGPVRMSAEEGCLLVDPVQGVAGYPPSSGTSISLARPQCGHSSVAVRGPSPLRRL